jgi:hypothetical protein
MNNSVKTMQGKMYRVVGEEIVEFVRVDNEILPVTDPRTQQCIGQLVIDYTMEYGNE